MQTVETLVVAICLGMDAFSVALGIGSHGTTARQAFRLSFHFGLFQFLMPLLGWLAGQSAVAVIGRFDHWVAFGILLAVGVHMIVDSLGSEKRTATERDVTRGWSLVGLSVATSMDALAVGVGLGILGRWPIGPAVVIGVVAALMTLTGLQSGRVLRVWVGQRMETVGGVVLIGLAVKMLAI